jgi:hypothetical protein
MQNFLKQSKIKENRLQIIEKNHPTSFIENPQDVKYLTAEQRYKFEVLMQLIINKRTPN